ncbi:hypothetical protein PI124_g22432 [Phytophthora idaei]|nr:hypothetical protein PI125_g24216 [Phytophthora idaei]KAG3126571.1 hypothetical protein PI126_g22261 [Phytophthora idaei]KAG3232485.1 hypothetical protein PI124_g22432 [Phytophthora idaei]
MCLIERSKLKRLEGKRILKFYYVIGDSKANARSRGVKSTGQDDVQWITDKGGYSLTLSDFESEEQARGHFIVFGHIVTWWDQLHIFQSKFTKNK